MWHDMTRRLDLLNQPGGFQPLNDVLPRNEAI